MQTMESDVPMIVSVRPATLTLISSFFAEAIFGQPFVDSSYGAGEPWIATRCHGRRWAGASPAIHWTLAVCAARAGLFATVCVEHTEPLTAGLLSHNILWPRKRAGHTEVIHFHSLSGAMNNPIPFRLDRRGQPGPAANIADYLGEPGD
jgi:hypothetical protein